MKTVKLKANSVSEFVYDVGNSRLIVYKNDSSIPRSIKCDEADAQKIVDGYCTASNHYVNFSKVPMIFSVRYGRGNVFSWSKNQYDLYYIGHIISALWQMQIEQIPPQGRSFLPFVLNKYWLYLVFIVEYNHKLNNTGHTKWTFQLIKFIF